MKGFGPGNPMIVAELSCNHSGELLLAEALVEAAKRAGADAVKFQVFEPGHMAPENGPRLTSGPWAGRTLHELYREALTPTAWLPGLFEKARALGMTPFASVFHPDTVEWCERELRPDIYKIASAEGGWPDLIAAVQATGKALFISDGGSALWLAMKQVRERLPDLPAGAMMFPHLVVLRCVAEYPAHCSKYSFADKRQADWVAWGLSDHSMAPVTWVTAAALGASVIEAHLMLPNTKPLDARHSLTPERFAGHARVARQAARMAYGEPEPSDPPEFRRRLLWARDLPAGHVVTTDDLACLRSPEGLMPTDAASVVGSVLADPVKRHEPVGG